MTSKGAKNCMSCSKELPKSGDYAYCQGCSSGFHLDECSITTSSWKKLGKTNQESWKCVSCKTKTRKGTSSTSTGNPEEERDTSEDFEVSSAGVSREILTKVNQLLGIRKQLDNMEKSLDFLSSQYDEILKEVKALRDENSSLKKRVDELERKDSQSRAAVDQLEAEVADLNQYGRRCNLEIHGLPVSGDPRAEDVDTVLSNVAAKIGLRYSKEQVHKAHRLQQRNDGSPATFLVQFFSREVRDDWIKAGKKAKLTGVYFNENLCSYFKGLLRDTKFKARACNYSYVWWQSGKILVRKADGDRDVIVIKSRKDLTKIMCNPSHS